MDSEQNTHKPVKGHSTNPRAEPTSIEEWQTWAETLQADGEALMDRIHALEKALTDEQASVKKYREETERLQRALNETEKANNDTRAKNGRLIEVYEAARDFKAAVEATKAPTPPPLMERLFAAVQVIHERKPTVPA